MANGEEGYNPIRSAFGGHPLADLPQVSEEARSLLEGLGYTDAEQVVAAAAITEVRPYLEQALGKELDDIVAAVRESLGEEAVMMAETPVQGTFALGVLPPTPEVEAEIAEAAGAMSSLIAEMPAAALPPSVNHALRMSPIRQQGGRGTCVGFSMTAMHEFYRNQSGTPQDFSEQFLYHQTKQIDGNPAACGTWAVKAAQVLAGKGQCREAVWPYNPNPPCNNNGVQPGNALADAAGFKLQPIVLNPKDVNAIKSALASGCVCEFSIPVYNSWYQSSATRQTGRITMRLPGEQSAGGHAMCLIGYQDDGTTPGGGFFILRNSWGLVWGSQCPYGAGNGTIPYAYLANDGWEAVTTPVPRRRSVPWWRRFMTSTGGEGGGEGGGRRTIIIETGDDTDIIIR